MTLRDCGQVPEPKCKAFVGLLPAIVSSWTRGWCSSIVATDASEYGFGVCLQECKKDVCEIIGQTSERARFRKWHPDTPGARTTFSDNIGSDLTLVVT